MLVSSIVIKWPPAAIPTTGSHVDWFRIRGELLRLGEVVTVLPEADFKIEEGPDATRPSERTPWVFEQAVDADTLTLDLYDAEYEHSITVNDVTFDLLDTRHDEWTSYSFILPATPEPPAPPTPPIDLGEVMNLMVTMMIVGMMMKMMSRMAA